MARRIFAAVPGLYRQILKYGDVRRDRLGALRHGLIAGEAPPPACSQAWKGRTGRELYEALGMSEISTYISTGPSVPRAGQPPAGRSRDARSPSSTADERRPSRCRRASRACSPCTAPIRG